MDIPALVEQQKAFFKSQKTRDLAFRKDCLIRLRQELLKREKDIAKAMHNDFRKPEFESILTETGVVAAELNLVIRKLKSWAKPRRVLPVLVNFPSTCRIHKEPFGTVLILAPWNYPFQLVLAPLVGAVAAGNTVVVKPSEHSAFTSQIIDEIITAVFEPGHVSVVHGESEAAAELLEQKWDYIFFTGSQKVGKLVAKAAAVNLTPTTLELGGKSPCIVDETANIKLAARRVVWGKFLNSGQTCIAPDYVLVHEKVKDLFIQKCKLEITNTYGENPQLSPDYCRIINRKNFKTLQQCIIPEKVVAGGLTDANDLYISPTLLDNPGLDTQVMKEEIFGPILPIIPFKTDQDVDAVIGSFEKPLALYIFSNYGKFIRRIIKKHSFGGGTINDTMVHFANHRLPFGGVGHSGTGAYHGRHSFDTFSSEKGITTRYNWLDIPVRYAPYSKKINILKLFLKLFT